MKVYYRDWLERDLEAIYKRLGLAYEAASNYGDYAISTDLSEMQQHVLAMQENLLAGRKVRQRYTGTHRQPTNK